MKGWWRPFGLTVVLTAILWQGGWAQMDATLLVERAKVRWTQVPKKVLAFYYAWYGNPETQRRWRGRDWREVDEANKRIGSSTHYPVLGPYSSHDPKVVEQHCRWAKEAGIDGFIVSWWQPNDFHDRAMPLILDKAQKFGLEVTAYFETVPNKDRKKALSDVLYLLNRYGRHPVWLKVNGKPVLFVYDRAIQQIGLDGWLWVIAEANRRYEGGAVFIGDQISLRAARIFDGIHTYNITGRTARKSVSEIKTWAERTFPQWVATAGEGRIACLSIIPGYDDSKMGRKLPRPITERHNGETYRVLWEAAIAANPDWVLITSWNEWHEGSEIEPSVEHGDRELKTTAELAPKFKRLPLRSPRPRPAAVTDAERQRLRDALQNIPIALLPDSDSEGAWFLFELGVTTPVELSWEQVVDPQTFHPQRFPIAVYAGGEVYQSTVKEPNDVLMALRRYVEAGGTLMVLSAGPMPFHYDYDRATGQKLSVRHALQLGLPLQIAWEQPLAGQRLTFVVRDKKVLPHLPERFPFPEGGDVRWRPLAPKAGVVPLVELVDAQGQSQGIAMGIVPVGKGRIFYAWFRLLDMPIGEALLHDLYALAVAKQ